MSLLIFLGRWAWLALIAASLLLGFILFRTIEAFDDSAHFTSDVAELRGYQEDILQFQILSLMLGVETGGSPDQILTEAEARADELIDRINGHSHDCEGCAPGQAGDPDRHSHEASLAIEAVIRDLHALTAIDLQQSQGSLEALGIDPEVAATLGGGGSDLLDLESDDPGTAGFAFALLAARYATLSASVSTNLDLATNILGEEGESAAARVRTVGRIGIGILLVGGILSTSGFAWAGRRARKLTWDVDRARELDALKSEFVGLASHELRTPLVGIYGFSELLLAEEDLPGHARDWAVRINDESGRLSEIVDDLLDISRIEAGETTVALEVVKLEGVIETVAKLFEDSPHHQIVRSGTFDATVIADRNRLVQVFSNLVDNAIKYSPDGGTVRIEGEIDGDGVRVRVTDEGLGIPADQLPLVFARFHRVRRAETENIRSTGLGLYLVRELLNLMNGTVAAESELDAGTTMTVLLPRLRQEDGEASAAA